MPYTSLPPTQPPARHQELQPPLSPNQKGRRHHSALGQGGERINGVRSPIPAPFLDAVGAAGCTQPLHLLSSGVWMLNIESLDVRHSLPFPSAALLCCPRWLGFPLARFVPQVVNWSLPGMITFPGEWDRNELFQPAHPNRHRFLLIHCFSPGGRRKWTFCLTYDPPELASIPLLSIVTKSCSSCAYCQIDRRFQRQSHHLPPSGEWGIHIPARWCYWWAYLG